MSAPLEGIAWLEVEHLAFNLRSKFSLGEVQCGSATQDALERNRLRSQTRPGWQRATTMQFAGMFCHFSRGQH